MCEQAVRLLPDNEERQKGTVAPLSAPPLAEDRNPKELQNTTSPEQTLSLGTLPGETLEPKDRGNHGHS